MSRTADLDNPFVEWLEEELKNRNWKSIDLAREADLPAQSISQILNRKRNVGRKLAERVAHALGYPEDFIFQKAGLFTSDQGGLSGDEEAIVEIRRLMADMDESGRKNALVILRALANAARDERAKQKR